MAEQPMTKAQVRKFLTRIRNGAAGAERALKTGNTEYLIACVQDIGGCAAEIEGALLVDGPGEPRGVRGMVA